MVSNASPSNFVRPLDANDPNNTKHRTTRAEYSRSHKFSFQGVPKCSPVNLYILGLRRYPIISTLKIKQLDITLDYVGYARENKASEEDFGSLKEYLTLKEDMKSP